MTIFDHAWRTAHAKAGDAMLEGAMSLLEAIEGASHESGAVNLVQAAQAYAAIAQAHYAAANVRAKPLVEGPWNIQAPEAETKTP